MSLKSYYKSFEIKKVMKSLLYMIIKSTIIVAVAVVCYYIYMAVIGK